MADNSAGDSPALLFVKFLYHQFFVTSVTKTNKTGLPLFCHLGAALASANLKQALKKGGCFRLSSKGPRGLCIL